MSIPSKPPSAQKDSEERPCSFHQAIQQIRADPDAGNIPLVQTYLNDKALQTLASDLARVLDKPRGQPILPPPGLLPPLP